MVTNTAGIESIVWDDWYAVSEVERLAQGGREQITLLEVPVTLVRDAGSGSISAFSGNAPITNVKSKYGLVWLSLGTPTRDIVDFPEFNEPDRRSITAGSTGVAVSGLRAVENFLDLSHLGIVHEYYLGEQPHNEILPYTVATDAEGGIIATECRVYQPKASPTATEGYDVDYIYRVLRPYLVVLYKANPEQRDRMDLIALCLQPVSQERCVAHIVCSYLTSDQELPSVRRFQQLIFGQDRPIVENQVPKRLPLDVRAEISVRCDGSSAAYRRYLAASGVRYGAIAVT